MCIEEAIDHAGGVPAVAAHFKIHSVSVHEWITRQKLPAPRVIPLAELTGWKYTPHMLDPVLYPNPTDGIPAAANEQVPS